MKNARPCLPNPDTIWPAEDMRAAMMIDAIAGLCPVPTMDEILAELRAEREAEGKE